MTIERPALSARQKAMLDFIKEEINRKGYPPTVREIGKAIGLTSTASVHFHHAFKRSFFVTIVFFSSAATLFTASLMQLPPHRSV